MFTAVIRGREAVNEMGRCRHCCSARQMPVTQIFQCGKSKGEISLGTALALRVFVVV